VEKNERCKAKCLRKGISSVQGQLGMLGSGRKARRENKKDCTGRSRGKKREILYSPSTRIGESEGVGRQRLKRGSTVYK